MDFNIVVIYDNETIFKSLISLKDGFIYINAKDIISIIEHSKNENTFFFYLSLAAKTNMRDYMNIGDIIIPNKILFHDKIFLLDESLASALKLFALNRYDTKPLKGLHPLKIEYQIMKSINKKESYLKSKFQNNKEHFKFQYNLLVAKKFIKDNVLTEEGQKYYSSIPYHLQKYTEYCQKFITGDIGYKMEMEIEIDLYPEIKKLPILMVNVLLTCETFQLEKWINSSHDLLVKFYETSQFQSYLKKLISSKTNINELFDTSTTHVLSTSKRKPIERSFFINKKIKY